MIQRLIEARENDEGFTLVELLVVIIIIGVLAAIAIPVFLSQREKGYDSAVKSDLRNAATAEQTVLTETGAYSNAMADLVDAGFAYSAATNYDGNAAVMTATANAGSDFCLTATSRSGTAFQYSTATGLGEGTCA
jgi:type IV pilus assembly protein PilA